MRSILEVEYTLCLDSHSHEPVQASEKVHNPRHIHRPVEKHNKSHITDHSSVHEADVDSDEGENFGDDEHADVIPAPAAMMSNEVSCGIIE